MATQKPANVPKSGSMQLSDIPAKVSPKPTNLSLLDTLLVWLESPQHAYSSWINSQDYEDSSKIVYTAMFGRFCQYLKDKDLRLDTCTEAHIGAFLETENPNLPVTRENRVSNGRQKNQYVRMLERVYDHLALLGMSGYNPGRKAAQANLGKGHDKPTRFLSVPERQNLIALIQTSTDELSRDEKKLERWVEIRDLAMIGVTIGAGMKLSHLRSMSLNCIKLEEGVIDKSAAAHSHRAGLLPFARDALALWLKVLAALTNETLSMKGRVGGTRAQWLKSQIVFVADRSGNGYGRFATTQRMHPTSIFRRIQAFLKMAGISGARASAQTLRNTYAALLIEGGASNSELVTCLGLAGELTAQRLRIMVSGKRHPERPVTDDPLPESDLI